ncbi:hypothetical protein FACS1894159_12070 [Bacteroidia bacterium]|nr:hypothetical protein FACS1894159_12070 [Bacteroidia bacterium]
MKRFSLITAFVLCLSAAWGQRTSDIRFDLGKGLNISFENGAHNIRLGGYAQSDLLFRSIKDEGETFTGGIKRAYFSLGGDFYNQRLSFMLRMNYVDSYPLLDAWIGYRPVKWLNLTVGQKQSFSGPLSMSMDDCALALGDRSLSDGVFFASGREFGLFAESRLPVGTLGFDLGLAATSGDGRNAFGSNSASYDQGGLKYSGRVSFYPLGFFATGNELTDVDFAREKKVKAVIGATYSYNNGASARNGEGQGEFTMYNLDGKTAYPGYQKISVDAMIKYRGLTLLAEYINATADDLQKLYLLPSPSSKLRPREIADYLCLGSGYTVQAGYLLPSNWAVDFRYSAVVPEWKDRQTLMPATSAFTLGVARYVIDNRLKLQLLGSYQDHPDMSSHNKMVVAEFIAHIVF